MHALAARTRKVDGRAKAVVSSAAPCYHTNTGGCYAFSFNRGADYLRRRGICFWAIEKFVNDARLANLLKILVVLICVGAILQRVLPLAGINWF